MKKIFTYSKFCLFALLAFSIASCEKEKLSEVITAVDGAKVSLALPNMVEVAGGDNYSLDNSKLIVPVTIEFNGATTKAFTVQTAINTDTVATLVANQVLPAGTVALVEGKYSIQPVVDIAYGVTSVSLDIVIDRSFMEINYGKNLALVLKMSDPAKGNALAAGKAATIILIKTGETIAPEGVHYVKFNNSTKLLNIPLGPNNLGYVRGSQDLTMALELALTGQAGAGFFVDLVKDQTVVDAAIANGSIPADVVKLDNANWSVSVPKVPFEAGKNTAPFNVNLRVSASIAFSGKIAMGLRIANPTRWQLATANTTLVVLFDPAHLGRKPFNANPFVIKGGIGEQSDFIPASNYDFGGEGVAYHDNGGRDGGQFRRPDEVDIADNNITIGWTNAGEWLTYTVVVEADGEYELDATLGSPNSDSQYSVFFGLQNVSGVLTAKQTPGGYGDQQPNYSKVNLKKGTYIVKFFMDRPPYDYKGMAFKRTK